MDKVTKFILKFLLKFRSLVLHIQMDVCKKVQGKKHRRRSSSTALEVKPKSRESEVSTTHVDHEV